MSRRSWVPGADGSGRSIDHLPYGVDRSLGPVVAIGSWALPLRVVDPVFDAADLTPFLAAGPERWSSVRARLQELVGDDAHRRDVEPSLVAGDDLELVLPFTVGDYVDFYSSIHHATNVGRRLRPDSAPLLPNYRHLPVGYHGRSGTVVVSGTPIRRPHGLVPDGEAPPRLAATRGLDLELEVGVVVGGCSTMGEAIGIDAVGEHLFGVVLLNDWSARDVQSFEYQPLGPFLAKSFATSISPWVTPLAALEPYRVDPPRQDPRPDSYLRTERCWAFDLELEVWLRRAGAIDAQRICRVNFSTMYWTMAQQLAHLTVNGASTGPGDLLGSGTVSGPDPGSEGSLLESGRDFLGDGDVVTLRGRAARDATLIELGEVTGEVVP